MGNYINAFGIFFLTLCCISCNTKNEVAFNKNVIERIAKEPDSLPSQFSGILFFCKCQDNEILNLGVKELKETYLNESIDLDYYTFLTDLLNQKKTIQCISSSNKFTINEDICNQYKKLGINGFLSFYCTSNGNNSFYLKNNIPDNQKNTIFYYLFTNNYLTSFDDYMGIFVIKKAQTFRN